MNIQKTLSKQKLLIGEGKDEVEFFEAYLRYLKIEDIQVEQYGGKDKLAPYLKTLLSRPGYQDLIAISIIRDADKSVDSAFKSVCSALKNAGFFVPNKSELGQVVKSSPSIGIFIMPDNKNSGMLEDLCLKALENDPILSCIDQYFQCVENNALRQPKEKNMSKAKIRAWLSSQEEPDKVLGHAAQEGYLPWDNSAFDSLKSFLQAI
jgi:hypothetical protein